MLHLFNSLFIAPPKAPTPKPATPKPATPKPATPKPETPKRPKSKDSKKRKNSNSSSSSSDNDKTETEVHMYVSVDEPTSPNEPDSVENLLQQADNIDNNNDPPPAIVKAEDQPVYAGVTIPVAEDVSTEETPDVTEDPPAEAAAEETAVEDAPGIYSSESLFSAVSS